MYINKLLFIFIFIISFLGCGRETISGHNRDYKNHKIDNVNNKPEKVKQQINIPDCFTKKPDWVDNKFPDDGNDYKTVKSGDVFDNEKQPKFYQFEKPDENQISKLEKKCGRYYILIDYYWFYNNEYSTYTVYGLCLKTLQSL